MKKAERLGYKALCLTETWTQDGVSFVELAQLDDLNVFVTILSQLSSYPVLNPIWIFHF